MWLVIAACLAVFQGAIGDLSCASCKNWKDGVLNVHIVPHSHDDVGWLKTVDQYYYGSRQGIQNAGVQYILDTVVSQLLHDPAKRFVQVETAFFWQWWQEQNDHMRHQVKQLVSNGQLELLGGGWVMNDEAVTHYQATVDQFTWGFRRLNDTFGSCGAPRAGWQIDPFGHSRETASQMATMGFDGLFFGRLDYADKTQRLKNKTAEMVWQGSPQNLGKPAELFTHVLFNNYSPPPGFCFDLLCGDEPFIDSKHSPDYNVDRRVKEFVDYAKKQSAHYTTNNIIMTMGEDFNYQDANAWYKNLDKLIKYVNAKNPDLNLFYSTPTCYLQAVNSANVTWSTKDDDFFPYPSDQHSYWTGYFTSRPTLKFFAAQGNNFLQVCKQLYALTELGPEDWADLTAMREAVAMMQHHDAITGTEQQHVAQDYALRLSRGFDECHFATEAAVTKLLTINSTQPTLDFESCTQLNISQCATTESSDQFVVLVFNPLSRSVSHHVRIPVTMSSYKVFDTIGVEVKAQMVPLPEPMLRLPGRVSPAKQELVFIAEKLPPLGYTTFYVQKLAGKSMLAYAEKGPERLTLKNKFMEVSVNEITGDLSEIVVDGAQQTIDQSFYFYEGAVGDNEEAKNRSSGAYIFRPAGDATKVAKQAKTVSYKGPIVQELQQTFSPWVSQVVRLYEDDPQHLELEWLVGPIPIEDGKGKEVVSRLAIDWKTDGIFYTDSNGREMMTRKRRENLTEPIAGNYYPVTTAALLASGDQMLAVFPDRAQGASSLRDGELELMVHRRLLKDDAFGVSEALNETAFGEGLVARGRHIVKLGSRSLKAEQRRLAQQHNVLRPWLLFAPTDLTAKQFAKAYKTSWSGLSAALPPNVNLLTLEPWKGRSLLLRLEHLQNRDDDEVLSKPVTVSLKSLFSGFNVTAARETSLGANRWLSDVKRMEWEIDSNEIGLDSNTLAGGLDDDFNVTLTPMQIRTFIIDVTAKKV
ncbi:lysosomal alpha-mannosidase [Cloeon dipterum]|uniref:lysosomal alpha-mannosidase n=1 Tax=Cloeon dipterum TaxID=197152 RepID=UPI0032201768